MFLSIENSYLMSQLPSLINGFKFNQFMESSYIERQFENDINSSSIGNIVVIPIKGAIVKHSNYNYVGTQKIIEVLKKIDKRDGTKCIVFDIDSGGGMVSGTKELADSIRSCQLPTVAFTNGYMCSAAYHIGAACNKVVASAYCDSIGSIGTMLSAQDFSGIWEKMGAKIFNIYAPESEEKNKAWREILKGNESFAQERLSSIAQEFIESIKSYRPIIKDDNKVFKGATYTSYQAQQIGLVDEIMSWEELINNL